VNACPSRGIGLKKDVWGDRMKFTAGAKLFLIGLMLVPVLLIGLLIVDETDFIKTNTHVAKKKTEKQVKFNDLYRFVRKNKEWYPFTYGLLEFYK
jgi:cell division protein FtsL